MLHSESQGADLPTVRIQAGTPVPANGADKRLIIPTKGNNLSGILPQKPSLPAYSTMTAKPQPADNVKHHHIKKGNMSSALYVCATRGKV